jgi:hypothetical protein
MPDEPILLYLEPDDEITSVVRRLRAADVPRVVIVAPGRSKATSSAVALRLLAAAADAEGRAVALVGDALTRSLAAEAGLAAYGTVEDASGGAPVPETAPRRAAIHVVRGDEPTAVSSRAAAPTRRPPAPSGDAEATQVVRTAPSPPSPAGRAARRPTASRRRRLPIVALAVLLALLVAAGAAAATVLPGATIRISPATSVIGPNRYELRFDDPQVIRGSVEATQQGTATETYHDLLPAGGAATFRNFNVVAVQVPAGTQVAAGDVAFATTAAVTAPPGTLTEEGTIAGSEATAPIVAVNPGPAGNVPAEAIDAVLDTQTRNRLRGFPQNSARLVINYEATAGGIDASGPLIVQADIDAAVAALTETLQAQVADALAETEDLIGVDPAEPAQPAITGADGLLDARDQPTFELAGELAYDRAVVRESEVTDEARDRIASAVAAGHELLPDSVTVSIESARREDGALIVTVNASGRSTARIDTVAAAERVAGLPIAAARAELADLGAVEIEPWPYWVEAMPALTWRIEVRVEGPAVPAEPQPQPSGSPAA